MIRGLPTTIACACLAGAVGIGLFFVKHEVKEQEARLSELNREIQTNQEAMHVLKAEWSYLNDPARLRALSEKHLAMKVMGPSQIASLDTLPAAGTAFAAARNTAPAASAVARAEPAPAKSAPTPTATVAHAAPVAKQPPAVVAKAAPRQSATPVKVAAPPAAAKPALVPGADTTPRLAATPVAAPLPAAQPQRGTAPVRTIVVQSPALASTPALPGEVR